MRWILAWNCTEATHLGGNQRSDPKRLYSYSGQGVVPLSRPVSKPKAVEFE